MFENNDTEYEIMSSRSSAAYPPPLIMIIVILCVINDTCIMTWAICRKADG